MSYGNNITEIEFKNGITNIAAINGSGKSSQIEALTYCLYGKPYRDIKLKELLNKTNKKGLFTEVLFDIGSDEFCITRKMSPDSIDIKKNGSDLELLSSKKLIQEEIDKILGIDYTLFKQILVLSVNQNKPFLKMTLQEKRDIVESIFNIKVFGEMLKLLKKDIAGQKVIKETNVKIISILEESINQMKSNIVSTKKALSTFDETKRKEIASEQSKKKTLDDDLLIIEHTIDSLKTKLSSIVVADKGFLEQSIKEFRTSLASKISEKNIAEKEKVIKKSNHEKQVKMLDEVSVCFKEVSDKRDIVEKQIKEIIPEDYAKFEDDISKMKDENSTYTSLNKTDLERSNFLLDNDVCPTCNTSLKCLDGVSKLETIDSLKANVGKRTEVINSNKTKIVELITKVKTIKEKIDLKRKLESDFKVLNVELASVGHEKIELENLVKENDPEAIEKLDVTITQIKSEITDLEAHIEVAEKDIQKIREDETKKKEIENSIKLNDVKLENIKKEIGDIDLRVKAIQERKFEIKVEELEKVFATKCSEYKELYKTNKENDSSLNNNLVVMEILSETGIKSFFMKKLMPLFNTKINEFLVKFELPLKVVFDEQMNDKVFNLGASRFDPVGYDSLSGGEQKRVDIAILFTFMDIVKMICNWNSNLLFIDELLDGAVDGEGLDKMLMCLKSMSVNANFEQSYYIISHRTFETEMFDRKITVKKISGFSRIEED